MKEISVSKDSFKKKSTNSGAKKGSAQSFSPQLVNEHSFFYTPLIKKN
jgi:hypothetical protein